MFRSLGGAAGNPFQNQDLRVVNRSAAPVAVGELVSLQLNLNSVSDTSGEATGGGPGQIVGTGTWDTAPEPYTPEDGIFANIITPANPAAAVVTMYGVVVDLMGGGGADDTEVRIRLQGVVDCNAVSGNYDIGDVLMCHTNGANKELLAYTAGDGNRPIAVCLTEQDSVESVKVMFWGWMAFATGNEA
jgi:hypothetical protein